MLKNYFVMVNPTKGQALRLALESEPQTREIKRILAELEGIGEINRGISRQMVLSRAEFRLVRQLNTKYELGIELGSL